ncbi:hypothetical protein X926_10010 [Petrotoga sp. HWHPT.55.6.3]|nr:hypothetical protein X926_10010 [Petrotoga sp. HWHPT.55.6.3]
MNNYPQCSLKIEIILKKIEKLLELNNFLGKLPMKVVRLMNNRSLERGGYKN